MNNSEAISIPWEVYTRDVDITSVMSLCLCVIADCFHTPAVPHKHAEEYSGLNALHDAICNQIQ